MNYFVLHTSCIPILGETKSYIVCLQNKKALSLPKEIIVFFLDNNKYNCFDISRIVTISKSVVFEILSYLESNNFGFKTDFFIPILKNDFQICDNSLIKSLILENKKNVFNEFYINDFIQILGEKIEFRCVNDLIDLKYLDEILNLFDNKYFLQEVVLTFNSLYFNAENIFKRYSTFSKVKKIILYNSPFNNSYYDKKTNTRFHKMKKNSIFEIQNKLYFKYFFNPEFYKIANKYNYYIYKKIYVDDCDNIKNADTYDIIYEKLKGLSIKKIIESNEFSGLWKSFNNNRALSNYPLKNFMLYILPPKKK